MRAPWCMIAVVVALAAVASATDLEDKVAKTIEEFKAMMTTGRPDLNIPVLEPFALKKLPLNINASPFNAKVVASDIQVAGASSFQVTQLSQVGDSSQVDVAVALDGVAVTGQYDIQGQVKVGFLKVKLNGNGPLSIAINGITGSGVADILSKDGGSIHMNDIKITNWNFDKLKINLDNLFNGGVMCKTVNKLINKLVPTLASANHDKLSALFETLAKKYVNKYLDGVTSHQGMLDVHMPKEADWVVTPEAQEILDQIAETVAMSSEDQTPDLEATVRTLSEYFRVAMKEGRKDLDIAAMDPAVFPELSVHFHKWLLDGQAVASDLVVSGASDFQLTNVAALDDTKVAIEYEIPSVSLVSQYALDAKVNLGLTKVHSSRNGTLHMNVTGVKCYVTAELVEDSSDGFLRLTSYQVDSWSYGSVSVQLSDPTSAGFIKKHVNKLIGKLVPSLLVKPHVSDITAWASRRGMRIIGRFLDGVAGRVAIDGLDKTAAALLSDLKGVMKTGSDAFGLPVLDPFVMDEIPFSFEGNFIRASVVAKEFQVSGTSAFTITKISQIPESNRITVDLEVPEINGSSKFTAKASLKWPAKNVTDNGSLTAKIRNLKVAATARLAENPDGSLILKELKIDSWTYAEISAEFANLQDSHIGAALNLAINGVLPSIVNMQRDVINSWAEVTAKAVLDQYLAGVAKAAPVHLNVIPTEARRVIMELAALAA